MEKPGASPVDAGGRPVRVVAALAGLAVVLVALFVLRPWGPAAIGYDSASSVLYFHRISDGHVLERFLGTTAKPLLTLVYGAAQDVTGDWRAVALLGVLAWGAGIVGATVLVGRVAGPAGAAFAAMGLIGCRLLLLDVSLAYAVSWALMAVTIAGLAATARRPRWILAGIALGAGALARQEVFLLIGAWTALLLIQAAVNPPRARRLLPQAAGVAIALLAVPVTMAHDWLLTGQPLYFLAVSVIGAEGREIASVRAATRHVVNDLLGQPVLMILALVGGIDLLRRRAWPMIVGLLVFGPGVSAFYVWITLRGQVALDRYLAPIDIAVVIAAAVGMDAGLRWVHRRVASTGRSVPPLAMAAAIALTAAAPIVLAPEFAPGYPPLATRIEDDRQVAADWEAMLPSVRAAVAADPALTQSVPPPDPRSRELSRPGILVPAALLPRAAVDLGTGLERTGALGLFGASPEALVGAEGSLIYVDVAASGSAMDMGWLLADPPAGGPVTLAPLDGIGGTVRLLRVDPGPTR